MFANSKAELLRAIGSGTTDIATNLQEWSVAYYGSSWYFFVSKFLIKHGLQKYCELKGMLNFLLYF